jgi:uncharacterized membrane protein
MRTQLTTRVVVYSGVLAAAYVVLTWIIAPLSYGPVQFRVSEILKPAALFHPAFAVAFGIGNGIANIPSPFGAWDFIAMSFVDFGAALCCWWLGRSARLGSLVNPLLKRFGEPLSNFNAAPLIAVIVQAVLISLGVAIFPLGIAAGFPFVPTFLSVLASELVLLIVGYFVLWRRFPAIF